MKSFINYLKAVRAELVHVSWPSTAQAIGYTLLIVVLSLVVAAFLGAFDFLFTNGIGFLTKLG